MQDPRYTKTPISVSLIEACAPCADCDMNVAAVIANDIARQDFPAFEMPYNQTTDQGLASLRSKYVMRDHEAIKAATHGDLPPGDGLSFRAPMAGQCENNQFPWQTDRFGKQRS